MTKQTELQFTIALPTHAEFINTFQIKAVLDVLEEENKVRRGLRKKGEKASHGWFHQKTHYL